MEEIGYQFEMINPNFDEKAIRFHDPKKLTLALANAKADALLARVIEPAILITSDQVVFCNREILEKPENEDEARIRLHRYHIYPPETVTAVVATNTVTKKRTEGVDVAKVIFRQIPESVIEEFIKKGDVLSRAGGFAVQDPILGPYIERIEGAIDSVIGLPKELTKRLIVEIESTG